MPDKDDKATPEEIRDTYDVPQEFEGDPISTQDIFSACAQEVEHSHDDPAKNKFKEKMEDCVDDSIISKEESNGEFRVTRKGYDLMEKWDVAQIRGR